MASPKLFGFFIIHLLVLFVSNPCVVMSLNSSTLCIKEERVALLKFKNYLKEPENRLSSWVGKDCCNGKYLSLNFVKVTSTADELFQTVIRMPSLLELYLMSCDLDTLPPSLPFKIITSPLSGLDLSGNPFKRSSIPSWLFNMSNLTYISLSLSSLRGPLPLFRRGNLCKLQNLDLSDNDLTGGVTQMLDTLSFCSNQSNMMNGKIPKSIGQLTQLNTLNLFQNNWDGTMTNIHFHNLTNLFSFSVSSKTNSFAFKATHDWIPPFKQLYYLKIHGCQVGPTFPNWLRNQTGLEYVILENAGISGEIPRWLYSMFSHIRELDLSHSKISGYLPKTLNFSIPLWCTITALDLRNNSLSGTVPANIGEEMSNMDTSGGFNPFSVSLTLGTPSEQSEEKLEESQGTARDVVVVVGRHVSPLRGVGPESGGRDPDGLFGVGSHIGNPQLCGNPLPTNCSSLSPGNVNQGRKHEDGVNEDDDKTERLCLYGSIALGYITGFWLVCGSLMLKRSWRYAYFKFVFDVCVLISVNLAYAKRRPNNTQNLIKESMAQFSGKTLVQWLVATLLIALLGGAQAVVLCNIDSSQLNLCRAAVTGQNPPPPDEKCCAVIRQANLPCLCRYKSILPLIGIKPEKALALPGKCGLQSPPNC
ncbi:Receptor-like protein EIX2 [Glycine soja]